MKSDQATRTIDDLILDLNSTDGLVRQRARKELVVRKDESVDALIKAFQNDKEPIHFQAAKALSQIGSDKAIETLISALEDDNFTVRWIAAEGLVAIGLPAIKHLLKKLEYNSESVLIREGAHHVFHEIVEQKSGDSHMFEVLEPVLDAYDHLDAELTIPKAAKSVIDQLDDNKK